jgi:uncharacterized protein
VILVSNTGPLIGLAKVRQIALLRQLATAVYIPSAVQRELLGKTGPEAPEIDAALGDLLQVRDSGPADASAEGVLRPLDEGERQAVRLAHSLGKSVLLLIDDRAGRQAALKLQQPFTGLAGLLLVAKQRGLLKNVVPLLEDLRRLGYWMSDTVLGTVKRLSNE